MKSGKKEPEPVGVLHLPTKYCKRIYEAVDKLDCLPEPKEGSTEPDIWDESWKSITEFMEKVAEEAHAKSAKKA